MRDDYLTSVWADNHAKSSGAIDKLIHAINHGFDRLNARRFAAPWRAPQRQRQRSC